MLQSSQSIVYEFLAIVRFHAISVSHWTSVVFHLIPTAFFQLKARCASFDLPVLNRHRIDVVECYQPLSSSNDRAARIYQFRQVLKTAD